MSELGKSCSTTCQKQNRSFSFVLPDDDETVTPKVLGHDPVTQSGPFGALECYVPSEDRYHTANRNSAKHHDAEDIATWKHENCKLACPCGRVGVNDGNPAYEGAPETVPVAVEEPVPRKEEDPVGQAAPRMVKTTTQEPGLPGFPTAVEEQAPVPPASPRVVPQKGDECKSIPADSCVAEFNYKGLHYIGCLMSDLGTAWCSTAEQYNGSWKQCINTCADKAQQKADVPRCTWQPSPRCSAAYRYKGVEYTGCITQDFPTPWCSIDRVHDGSWEICKKLCSAASGSVAVIPGQAAVESAPSVTSIPKEALEPCQRQQGQDDDTLGSNVSLDEVGFNTIATTGSTSDMKRFVCRVVAGMGCRVADPSGLTPFVPFYSSTVAIPLLRWPYRKTYATLESRLSALCVSGGTSYVPTPA